MTNSTHFDRQVLDYLRQYSHYCDLRHLKPILWGSADINRMLPIERQLNRPTHEMCNEIQIVKPEIRLEGRLLEVDKRK